MEAPEAETPTAAERETECAADSAEAAEMDEANFLMDEDVANLDRIPATPTAQECRLLWAGLLEIQDEEAMHMTQPAHWPAALAQCRRGLAWRPDTCAESDGCCMADRRLGS